MTWTVRAYDDEHGRTVVADDGFPTFTLTAEGLEPDATFIPLDVLRESLRLLDSPPDEG